jgi:hypothetical protein
MTQVSSRHTEQYVRTVQRPGGISLGIVDMCWCNRPRLKGEAKHSRGCAKERRRRGL